MLILFTIMSLSVMLFLSKSDNILGLRTFSVLSGSMQPTIPVGGLVTTQHKDNYQVGDIITFKTKGPDDKKIEYVTHRIIEEVEVPIEDKVELQFKTQGDANENADERLVPKENIVGKSIVYMPFAGRITNFMQSQLGLVLLIIIPATIIIYSELINIKNEAQRLLKERKKRKLSKFEKVEVEVGEEVMAVEKEVKKDINIVKEKLTHNQKQSKPKAQKSKPKKV